METPLPPLDAVEKLKAEAEISALYQDTITNDRGKLLFKEWFDSVTEASLQDPVIVKNINTHFATISVKKQKTSTDAATQILRILENCGMTFSQEQKDALHEAVALEIRRVQRENVTDEVRAFRKKHNAY